MTKRVGAPSHGGKTRVFICGGDERLGLDPDETKCPNVENHALHPLGYADWHEWASEKNKTHKNSKCDGCGRFTIWTPRVKRPSAATPTGRDTPEENND